MDKAKAFFIPKGPFVIIHQRPCDIAFQGCAILNRAQTSAHMGIKIGYARHIWLFGCVGITEALGEVTLLYFDSKGSTGDDPVIAKLSGIHPSKRGQVLRLGAAPEKIHLFHKGISLLYRGDKVFLPNVAPH